MNSAVLRHPRNRKGNALSEKQEPLSLGPTQTDLNSAGREIYPKTEVTDGRTAHDACHPLSAQSPNLPQLWMRVKHCHQTMQERN